MTDTEIKRCEDCGWGNRNGHPYCTYPNWNPSTCLDKRGWKPRAGIPTVITDSSAAYASHLIYITLKEVIK